MNYQQTTLNMLEHLHDNYTKEGLVELLMCLGGAIGIAAGTYATDQAYVNDLLNRLFDAMREQANATYTAMNDSTTEEFLRFGFNPEPGAFNG